MDQLASMGFKDDMTKDQLEEMRALLESIEKLEGGGDSKPGFPDFLWKLYTEQFQNCNFHVNIHFRYIYLIIYCSMPASCVT